MVTGVPVKVICGAAVTPQSTSSILNGALTVASPVAERLLLLTTPKSTEPVVEAEPAVLFTEQLADDIVPTKLIVPSAADELADATSNVRMMVEIAILEFFIYFVFKYL